MEILVILEQLKAIGITQISEYTLKDFFAQRDYINTTGQEIKEQAKAVGIKLKPCNVVIPEELFPIRVSNYKKAETIIDGKRKLYASKKFTKKTLHDLYIVQGKTRTEIAEIYKLSVNSIYSSLKAFEIEPKIQNKKPFILKIEEDIEKIKELHKTGTRLLAIANQYDVTVPTITKILAKNGYSARKENNKKKVK